MSLQIWLPLTKNFQNQGLCNISFKNNGAIYNTEGKLGGCYQFNNSTISAIPTAELKNIFNNKASLTCWVKVSSSHNTNVQCITLGTISVSQFEIYFGISINEEGIPIGNIADGSNYTNCSFLTSIKDNKWHHLCLTYDTDTIKSYLDGTLKATISTSYTPTWSNATIFTVGGNSLEVFTNADSMNDIRLYNHCLSFMEVKELSKGLILHYLLSQTDTETNSLNNIVEYDCSGYCNNGIRVGTFTWSDDTPKYLKSTIFSGSQLIKTQWNLKNITCFTIAGWFYNSDGTVYYSIENDNNTCICLEQLQYSFYNTSGFEYSGNYTNTHNVWQHIVLTYDAFISKLKLYINGNFVSEVATSGNLCDGNTLTIGGQQNLTEYIGKISDFKVYVTALSIEDIIALYQNSIYIDNTGNIYGILNEVSDVSSSND